MCLLSKEWNVYIYDCQIHQQYVFQEFIRAILSRFSRQKKWSVVTCVLIVFTCSPEISSTTNDIAHKLNLIQSKVFKRRRWLAPYNSSGRTAIRNTRVSKGTPTQHSVSKKTGLPGEKPRLLAKRHQTLSWNYDLDVKSACFDDCVTFKTCL